MYSTFLLSSIVLSVVSATLIIPEFEGDTKFRKIEIPEPFAPTSSVSIAVTKQSYVELFYRGSESQLLHATMFQDGEVTSVRQLGGKLFSAPAAVSSQGNNLDIAYVTEGREVVTRAFRHGSWGDEVNLGIKSEHAPAIVASYYGNILIVVARLDGNIVSSTRHNGKWSSVKLHGVKSSHSPAATLNFKKVHLFVQGRDDKVYTAELDGQWTPWAPLDNVPQFTSGICVSPSPERTMMMFGRGVGGYLAAAQKFRDYPWEISVQQKSPRMDGAPSCFFAFQYCVEIIIWHAGDLYRSQYCS